MPGKRGLTAGVLTLAIAGGLTALAEPPPAAADPPPNLAANQPYLKTQEAPPDAQYPDTGDQESTDGIIAGGYGDGRGYGYRLAVPGQTETVHVLVDIGGSRKLSRVRVARYDHGTHDYAPDLVRVYAGNDPAALTLRRESTAQSGPWFDLVVGGPERYVRVELVKTRDHDGADWMFVDEIQILDISSTNIALGRPYTKTRPATPAAQYPDSGDRESTDEVIAGGYDDAYGYPLTSPGQTVTVDVTVDIAWPRTLTRVSVHRFGDGGTDYAPDSVKVWTGNSPVTMTLQSETSTPSGQWFELPVSVSARYIKVQLTKTRSHDQADWMFVDEIAVLGS